MINLYYSTLTIHDKIIIMLKYIKNYASTIKDIDIYPIISLGIFVLFFVAVIYYVKKMDKRKVDEIKHMPLDLDIETNASVHTIKQA
jgi:cytochrome c oxidase cbb3-type subunit IV